MKVFISWSGERSHALAQVLRDRLPLVLHYVEPWLSQSDIEAGERWGIEVAKELEACTFGITCITPENIGSPWILFEAGALAKSMQEGRVIPLLLDMDFSDISGPLAQFQAKKVEKQGVNDVIQSLNRSAQAPVPEPRLGELFEALWPQFEKGIGEIPKHPNPTKRARPQSEVLEELVAGVRNLDIRYREITDDAPSISKRRKGRFVPMILDETLHNLAKGPADPIAIVMTSSMFREDLPWLYELGLEVHRSAKAGQRTALLAAIENMERAVDIVRRGPVGLDESVDRRALHMLLHTLELTRERYLNDQQQAKSTAASSRSQKRPE